MRSKSRLVHLAVVCVGLAGCVALDERQLDAIVDPLEPFGGNDDAGALDPDQPNDPGSGGEPAGESDVRAAPEAIDFGPVSLGVNAAAGLTLTNEGAPLTAVPTARIEGELATDFRLIQNYCVAPLGTDQSCQIEVGLTAARAGLRQATLVVEAGPSTLVRVPLSGTGLAPALFTIEGLGGTTSDFGSVKVNSPVEQRLRVTNGGAEASGVLTLSLSGSDFSFAPASVTAGGCVSGITSLEVGQSCELGVIFQPLDRGQRFATLTVASADQGASLGLSGRGLGPAALVLSPALVDYGPVVRGGAAQNWLQLQNDGDEPSGALAWSVTGSNAANFSWDATGCPSVLAPLGTCPVRLDFAPSEAGAHSASFQVAAEPGGNASVSASGEGLLPGALSVTAEAGGSASFDGVLQGSFADRTFVVTNTGNLSSGAISVSVLGSGFSTITGGTCQNGLTDLAGGASCTARVRFQPVFGARGPVTGTLSVVSASGGNSLGLSAQALALASLVAQGGTQRDFGVAEVNTDGGSFEWVLQNPGDVPSEVPTIVPSGADFRISNGCGTAIAPQSSCSVSITFAPRALGSRSGSVSARVGGSEAVLFMTGAGQVRLTVQFAGVGGGQVTSQPPGISCTGTAGCSALFSVTSVALEARTTNGTDSLFGSWSEASCPSPQRSCNVPLSASRTVTATFNRVTNNIAFVTSQTYSPALGSVAAYDTRCNSLASAAGINNAAGDGYLAAMSTTGALVTSRFGAGVQGWVRMDGRPFISTLADVFQRRVLHHPVTFDENGVPATYYYMTGTNFTGQLDTNCEGWTSNRMPTVEVGSYTSVGSPTGGPDAWTDTAVGWCNEVQTVLCLGRTKTAALTIARNTTARRIWVTATPYVPGSMTPDAKCQSERPTGVVTASALVAYTNRAASAVIDPAATYRRLDNLVVGTGAQLIAKQPLTGIWIAPDGTSIPSYLSRAWSGSNSFTTPGTANQTCNNWTATTENFSGTMGFYHSGGPSFWGAGDNPCSHAVDPVEDRNPHLYCVER